MEGATGERQTYGWVNQWASWHLNRLHGPFFQRTLTMLKCVGYRQIIWQKVCEVSRETMFGWDPDWSGSQEQESSYWMGTQRQSHTLLLSTTTDMPDTQLGVFLAAFCLFSTNIGKILGLWPFPASNYHFILIILTFENPLLVNRIRNLYLQSWGVGIFIRWAN